KMLMLAAALAGVGLISGIPTDARATQYQLNLNCGGGNCTTFSPSFGTVDITGNSSALTFDFHLTNGGFFDSNAFEAAFFQLTAGSVVTSFTINGDTTNPSFWHIVNTGGPPPVGTPFNLGNFSEDGMGSGWNFAFDCSTGQQNNRNCGPDFSVTLFGSNIGSTFNANNNNGNHQVFAGVDLSCINGQTCSNSTFQTGGIGATAAVPGPLAGAGLPGLIAACGGLIALARRRRQRLN